MAQNLSNESVHWFMEELKSRIIAESGISTDGHHLGKLTLQSFKDAPDYVMQIDGATDEYETFASALERTVRCANCMKSFGLQLGDVIVLMAPNHVNVSIPMYAALYLGVIVSPIDRTLLPSELQIFFNISKPKLIFCQSEKATDVQLALNNLGLNAQIVTFDNGDYLCNFNQFMEQYGDDSPIEEFKPTDFDPEETIAFLIATSGTTGLPKTASTTHKNFAISLPYIWSRSYTFPTPTQVALIGSPLQWLTAIMNFVISPILRYTRLQTSEPMVQEHAYHLINTYKPTFTVLSATMMTTLLRPGDRARCDFTCFELIMLGGSAVPTELIEEIKKVTPLTEVINVYGMTELSGLGMLGNDPAPGSCGKPLGSFQYRIVNVETQEDVTEPHKSGELWMKGPCIFKNYYNNEEATEDSFSEGRWFKTGDLFYRDENWNLFFLERIKLLLKYKSYQISPVEVESVIRKHPAVLDVAVTGVPDDESGDLPVALVLAQSRDEVTAEEIKDLVKENLSDAKQLRGGVIFVDAIPMTASTKVHRRKIKQMALELPRE